MHTKKKQEKEKTQWLLRFGGRHVECKQKSACRRFSVIVLNPPIARQMDKPVCDWSPQICNGSRIEKRTGFQPELQGEIGPSGWHKSFLITFKIITNYKFMVKYIKRFHFHILGFVSLKFSKNEHVVDNKVIFGISQNKSINNVILRVM